MFPGREAPNIAGGSYRVSAQAQTSPAGGSETRPKNVNVNWIIKARSLPAS